MRVPLELVALPALADNYIWMLHDSRRALVVDPGDAAPVERALERGANGQPLELQTILVTHHHADHTGGVARLMHRRPDVQVVGPARERLPFAFEPVHDGDAADWLGWSWQVLDVPAHTAGHVAYVGHPVQGTEDPILFCGDTMFSAGCGRLFEGTPTQLRASLDRLAALPAATRVCCTHEYTLANLAFAAAVEPGNAAIGAWRQRAQALRDAGRPTLPTTVGDELGFNPFLRTTQPDVVAAARMHGAETNDPVAVTAALRRWKDDFR